MGVACCELPAESRALRVDGGEGGNAPRQQPGGGARKPIRCRNSNVSLARGRAPHKRRLIVAVLSEVLEFLH